DEVDFTALIVAALYANMTDFEVFTGIARLYFAAASYSETRRRLGRETNGFLLVDHPQFGARVSALARRAMKQPLAPQERASLLQKIREVIQPFDLAGLNDSERKNWHRVRAEDLLTNHEKVGAS